MTLTEAAYWTKKLVWFVVIGFFLFFLLIIILIKPAEVKDPFYSQANYSCTNSAEEFLQHELNIPSLEYTMSNPNNFRLETDTGRFHRFPEIINVYRYANPGQTLNALRDAQFIAERLDFNPDNMRRVGTTEYQWADHRHRALSVEARNLPFIFKIDLSKDVARPPVNTPPTESEAINLARTFLRSNNFLNEDYLNEPPTTIDISLDSNGNFSEALARVDANLVRVDFQRMKSMITIPENAEGAENIRDSLEKRISDSTRYRSNTETIRTPEGAITNFTFEIELVGLDPNKSNISVYIGHKNERVDLNHSKNIYGIDYKNWILESEHCGTYELVTPDFAIEQVQAGNGSLIYLRENNADRVEPHRPQPVERFDIRNISLRYYDAQEEQSFLQPIYVIYGDAIFTSETRGEFVFYYPAIDYDLVKDRVVNE